MLAGQERSYLSLQALEEAIRRHEEGSPHLSANGRWQVGSAEYLNAGRKVLKAALEQKMEDIRGLLASQHSWQRLISKQHGTIAMKRTETASWH